MRLWLVPFVWSVLWGCGSPPAAPTHVTITRQRLARLPATYRSGGLAVADDGRTWMHAIRTDAGVEVTAASGSLGTFVETSPPAFTVGGHLPFFWTLLKEGEAIRVALFMNGQTIATPFARPTPVFVSPDGRHWAVAAAVGSVESLPTEVTPIVVMVDGVERGRYRDTSKIAFSHDGAHAAWLAENDAGVLSLVVDGVERRTYPAPSTASGHPVSEPLRRSTMAGEMPLQYPIAYLSDGRLLAVVRDRAGWTIERDGTALASYPFNPASRADDSAPDIDPFALTTAFTPASLVTADDAPTAVWWERLAGAPPQWRIVRDGEPVDGLVCLNAWPSQPPVLSPDGRHVAYVCPTNDGVDRLGDAPKAYVVVDGRRFGSYANVWGLRLSDDGAHAVWAAATSRDANAPWRYAIDGHLLDREVTEAYRPRLDAGNAHLGWLGRMNGRLRVGLDDTPLATVDEVLWGPKFVTPDTLAWVVRRKHTLLRLEAKF